MGCGKVYGCVFSSPPPVALVGVGVGVVVVVVAGGIAQAPTAPPLTLSRSACSCCLRA